MTDIDPKEVMEHLEKVDNLLCLISQRTEQSSIKEISEMAQKESTLFKEMLVELLKQMADEIEALNDQL